jgi:hypothetical protein
MDGKRRLLLNEAIRSEREGGGRSDRLLHFADRSAGYCSESDDQQRAIDQRDGGGTREHKVSLPEGVSCAMSKKNLGENYDDLNA